MGNHFALAPVLLICPSCAGFGLKMTTYAAALECGYHTKQDYTAYFSSIHYFQWEKTTMLSPLAATVTVLYSHV